MRQYARSEHLALVLLEAQVLAPHEAWPILPGKKVLYGPASVKDQFWQADTSIFLRLTSVRPHVIILRNRSDNLHFLAPISERQNAAPHAFSAASISSLPLKEYSRRRSLTVAA